MYLVCDLGIHFVAVWVAYCYMHISYCKIKCAILLYLGKRYGSKKSLIILTSGVTAGAAEEFVFIMKRLGRAMIVGETTRGGCHPQRPSVWAKAICSCLFPSSTRTLLRVRPGRGAGIAPHIPVPADAALDTAKGMLYKHFSGQK